MDDKIEIKDTPSPPKFTKFQYFTVSMFAIMFFLIIYQQNKIIVLEHEVYSIGTYGYEISSINTIINKLQRDMSDIESRMPAEKTPFEILSEQQELSRMKSDIAQLSIDIYDVNARLNKLINQLNHERLWR